MRLNLRGVNGATSADVVLAEWFTQPKTQPVQSEPGKLVAVG